MVSSVGSVIPALLACAGGVLDDDKVGHAVVPVSPAAAGDEELISASLEEDTAPAEADTSSCGFLAGHSFEGRGSVKGRRRRDFGWHGGGCLEFFLKNGSRAEKICGRPRPWMTCQIVIM